MKNFEQPKDYPVQVKPCYMCGKQCECVEMEEKHFCGPMCFLKFKESLKKFPKWIIVLASLLVIAVVVSL